MHGPTSPQPASRRPVGGRPGEPHATPPDDVVTCPHARTCGACALLDWRYARELEAKRTALVEALQERPRLARVPVLPTLASPLIRGYRNRAKMAVGGGRHGEPVELGYFRAGTRRLVDAPDCQVIVPELLQTTRALRRLWSRESSRIPGLRFIDLRCGTDPRQQLLTLVIGSERAPHVPIDEIRKACPRVAGIGLNLNPGSGGQVVKGPIRPLLGAREVFVDTSDLRLRVSAASFFQVNLSLLPAVHERMRLHLHGCRALADLYAGVGTHGLSLSRTFDRVTCVEGVPRAVRDARASAEAAGLSHVTIVGSPVERALPRFLAARADAVVLNPSREGVRREVIDAVAHSCARRVAYLSCEPDTLARDLDVLAERGFRVASAQAVDMMPQTAQVEALALLERD
jgi:23S rRNA (uracil1939-C5)-methyltransferase